MGALSGGVVVFGDEGAEPLLVGVTALESAGIEIDPQNRRLKPQSRITSKGGGCGAGTGGPARNAAAARGGVKEAPMSRRSVALRRIRFYKVGLSGGFRAAPDFKRSASWEYALTFPLYPPSAL